jgi:hypothetical protein
MFGMVILIFAVVVLLVGIVAAILIGLFIWQAVREWKGKHGDD